jgi:hypothetical protein
MRQRACLIVVIGFVVVATAGRGWAEDRYFRVPVDKLQLTEGELPEAGPTQWRRWQMRAYMQPRIVMEGEAEGYLERDDGWDGAPRVWEKPQHGFVVVARSAAEGDLRGNLYLPKSDDSGKVRVSFVIPANEAGDNGQAFNMAKAAYYDWLQDRQIAGTAWFRHQRRVARGGMPEGDDDQPARNARFNRGRDRGVEATFDLFSGGRAVRENLQLDRQLQLRGKDDELVDVDSIEGIAVQQIDWKPLLKDAEPELDPLARLIPADQHVVFFPSFAAATRLSDELGRQGTALARLLVSRSEDERVRERYERQLCLPLSALARLLGPRLISSVALTGSDPYLFTGTDVAVLFETTQPAALEKLLLGRAALAAKDADGAKPISGKAEGLSYTGFRSPDRRVSCYIARLEGAVVVTNSPWQLTRLSAVASGESEALTALDEYKFFRQRYPLGHAEETALCFLSDAAIRRWSGPRWRIAASRRLREAAVMSELTADFLDQIVTGKLEPGPVETDLPLDAGDQLRLSQYGVVSANDGTLEFQTPIVEMAMDQVTKAESEAYITWREGYQRNWRWAFDPIALRVTVNDDKLAADLSVMPLIFGTEYRELVDVSRGASIATDGADRHAALAQLALALNVQSNTIKQYGNFAQSVVRANVLGWIGSSLSLYADPGEFWQQLAEQATAEEAQKYASEHFNDMPMAFYIEVANALKLTAFMTALRAWIDQTAPGMVAWESHTYRDEPYVTITPTERAQANLPNRIRPTFYYTFSADGLLFTPNEALLKRYLDRVLVRRAAANGKKADDKQDGDKPKAEGGAQRGDKAAADGEADDAPQPWLGESFALQVDGRFIQMLLASRDIGYRQEMAMRSWSNLPILNEWHRLYPDRDPVELHEQVWRTRLVCPGGGKYVWNDEWQTMESTVFGHPGHETEAEAPNVWGDLLRASFGITFENQGLRARAEATRQ